MPPQGGLTGPDVADGRRAPRAAALLSPVPRAPRNGNGQRGFTMIELVAVLVIMAVIAVIAADRVFDQSQTEIGALQDQVRSHIAYARTRSMNADEVFGVVINGEGASYSIFRNGNTATRVVLPGEADGTIALPQGATISSSTTPIFFDRWGAPCQDAAGATRLADTTITLRYQGRTAAIIITRNTGFLR